MGKKTVADYDKFKKECKKLTEPKGFKKCMSEIEETFTKWEAGGKKILVEIHFDDATNEITAVNTRVGNSKLDFYP